MICITKEELQQCFEACQQSNQRFAQIIDADVGSYPDVPADGAYDLFRQAGSPAEIGLAIAKALEDVELIGGGCACVSVLEEGEPIYLNIKIRLVLPECGGEPEIDKED